MTFYQQQVQIINSSLKSYIRDSYNLNIKSNQTMISTNNAIEQQKQKQHPLQKILQKKVKVIANDGRVFVGQLRGLDQAMNCILSECEERIYSLQEPVRRQMLGTYFMRGETIVIIGELVQEEEDILELQKIKCSPLSRCQ